jgi:para-nitrobenzyl esterase
MSRPLALVSLALLTACASREPAAPAPPVADAATRRALPAGEVIGAAGLHGGRAWLGIPFAQPPVGALRWRAPQPLAPWEGVREALSFAPPCPQFASPTGGVEGEPGSIVGSEDCLYLNVYAPDAVANEDARLPVMVWIHGGGNTIGATSYYDGSALATNQNVIVVTIAYRLGALGWFRHASLRRECGPVAVRLPESAPPTPESAIAALAAGPADSASAEPAALTGAPPATLDPACLDDNSGNFGTLDQIRALEWVRDNIAAFGGDPANVTIFGESAGGRNVLALLVSPRAAGLFQRVISQSGGTRSSSLVEAENLVGDSEPGGPTSSGEIVKKLATAPSQLREVAAESLLRAYGAGGIGMYELPQVFADGHVLPAEPTNDVIRAGRHNRVPALLGTNKDENKLFFVFTPRYAWRLFGVLPILKDETAFFRDASYAARSWKISGADEPARALTAAQPGSAWVYRWDWDEEPTVLWADFGELLGAAHGLEIAFVFGHWRLGSASGRLFNEHNAAGRERLSAAMQGYWAQFARSGDPARGTQGDLPAWTAWDEAGGTYIVLDTDEGGGIRLSREVETLDDLIAAVEADSTYESTAKRCTQLAHIQRNHGGLYSASDFASAASGACGEKSALDWIAAAR